MSQDYYTNNYSFFHLDSVDIGVWSYSLKTKKLSWSKKVFELYERDIELGTPSEEEEKLYYSPEDSKLLSESATKAIKTKKSVKCIFRPLLKSNRKLTYESTIFPDFNREGELSGLTGIVFDITEKINLEKLYHNTLNNYKNLFENSPMPYQSLDINGNLLEVNNLWCENLGYSKEEVIGKNFSEFLIDEEKDLFIKRFSKFKSAGKVDKVNFKIKTKNNQWIDVLFNGRISYDSKGNFIQTHCIFENLTDKKHNEELSNKIIYDKTLLSKISSVLLEFNTRKEILDFIGDEIYKLLPSGSYFLICDYLSETEELIVHKIYGISEFVKIISKLIGTDVTRYKVKLSKYSDVEITKFKEKTLTLLDDKIYDLSGRTINKTICRQIEKLIGVKTVYNAGFSWTDQIFGGISIVFKNPDFSNFSLIESILSITSVALQRVLMKESLIKSEEKYRIIAEKTSDVIWLMSLEGKSIYVTPSIERFTGFTVEEYLCQSIDDRFTPESAIIAKQTFAVEMAKYAKAPDKLKVYNIKLTLEYIHKNGGTRIGELIITPYFDEKNRLIGIHGVTRDITERVKNQTQISLLSKAIEQSPASIVITNIFGEIQYVNPKFIELTCYSYDEVVGKNSRILKSEGIYNPDYKELWNTINSGKEWNGEFLNKKKNGELYWEKASISPVKDENNNVVYFVAVKEDITETKKYIETLHSKNEDLKEFAYIISHNLRAPIANLKGLSSLLEEEPESIYNKKIIKNISISAETLDRTIQDLNNIITIKSLDNLPYEKFNIYNLIQEITQTISIEIESKKIQIRIFCEKNLEINSVKSYMYNILFNLISNAVKYSDINKNSFIEILVKIKNENLIVKIQDNGIGIDIEKYRDKIFGLYKRFNNKVEGKGIGLYLVKSQVKQLNGTIDVESKLEVGTKFTLEIPLQ